MSRAPRSVASHARRKKVFKQAKGFYGRRKNKITSANAAVDRSLQHNYIGRKEKKRNFRALWIQRINAGCREHGLTYSRFISGLAKARHRDRPQGPLRPRHPRARRLQGSGGSGRRRKSLSLVSNLHRSIARAPWQAIQAARDSSH